MATKNGKKDPRYKMVSIVLKSDAISAFRDIFRLIPKSTVAKDMHMNNNRMQSLIDNPGDLTLNEVKKLADLFGCEYIKLRDMVEKAQGLSGEKKMKAAGKSTPPAP